jgi:putative hemolysin
MSALARMAAPAVWVLSASTSVVLRLMRLPRPQEPPVTEAEIKVLLEQGAEAGVFEPGESEMVTRVFRLGDQRVSAVMTPRHRAVWLDADAPFEEARVEMAGHRFSRYLLCEGELDRVVGVVDVRDLWVAEVAGEPVRDLRAAARQPLVVLESMRALHLLERFRESGMHLALVVDEYGGVAGVATLNDILSEVAGDLTAGGPEHPAVVRREDGSLLVDGALPMEEVRELLGLHERRGDFREYRSLGGWIFTELGRVPTEGDHFEAEGHRIEVVDMDGNRIDKVLVQRLARGDDDGR